MMVSDPFHKQVEEYGYIVFAVIYKSSADFELLKKVLSRKFGEPVAESDEYSFSKFSDYYEAEMGRDLKRRIIVFDKAKLDANFLIKLKLFSLKLEKRFVKGCQQKRTVNIDPGFLTKEKFVLLSFKKKPRKIYLGKGVWADLLLLSRKKHWETLPWTFPEFKDKSVQEFLLSVINDGKGAVK